MASKNEEPGIFRLPGSVSQLKPKEGTYWRLWHAFGSDPLLMDLIGMPITGDLDFRGLPAEADHKGNLLIAERHAKENQNREPRCEIRGSRFPALLASHQAEHLIGIGEQSHAGNQSRELGHALLEVIPGSFVAVT